MKNQIKLLIENYKEMLENTNNLSISLSDFGKGAISERIKCLENVIEDLENILNNN